MTKGYYDGHVHSCHSDGILKIDQLAAVAEERSLEFIADRKPPLLGFAITDHEKVFGAISALENQYRLPVRVIPGVEIGTKMKIGNHNIDFEIKALFIDPYNEDLQLALLSTCYHRIQTFKAIAQNISKEFRRSDKHFKSVFLSEVLSSSNKWANLFGYLYSPEDYLKERAEKLKRFLGINEINIAEVALAELYSIGRGRIAELLFEHGLTKTKAEGFEYILNDAFEGKPGNCFIRRERHPVEFLIKIIHNAGGVCGPCHLDTIFQQYKRLGLTREQIYLAMVPFFESGDFSFGEFKAIYSKTIYGMSKADEDEANDLWSGKAKKDKRLQCNGSDGHQREGGTEIGDEVTPAETMDKIEELANEKKQRNSNVLESEISVFK